MSELLQICSALGEARRAHEPTWLASLVGIEGSAYRRPGARLLFGRDGALAGSLSGGCVDREVVRTGAWSSEGGAVVRCYDPTSDEIGAGTGCGGKLQVLIEPVLEDLAAMLGAIGRELALERRIALATVVKASGGGPLLGERLLHGYDSGSRVSVALSTALARAFSTERARVERYRDPAFDALLEVVDPSPHVFVFGCQADVVPLARFAQLLDWRVTVCARGQRFSVADRFAGLAELKVDTLANCVATLDRCARPLAFVMSHDYEHDRDALAALLGSRASYIGVLGPATRTARMLSEIDSHESFDEARRARIHGPAGLHLGAETSEEIALSMIAEAQAVLSGASAKSLRDRKLGIHELTASVTQAGAFT